MGIAALDHKTWYYAVKGGTVIKAFPGELNEVVYMIRRHIREKPEFNVPEFCFDNRFGIGHFFNLLFRKFLIPDFGEGRNSNSQRQ